MSIYEYNTLGVMTPNYFSPVTTPQGYWSSTSNSGIYNPVAMANSGYWKVKSERIMPKFNLQYWIVPEVLKYQVDLAFDINTSKDNRFLPQTATGRLWPEISVNRATDLYTEAFVVQSFNRLYYTPKMGKDHEIVGLLQIQYLRWSLFVVSGSKCAECFHKFAGSVNPRQYYWQWSGFEFRKFARHVHYHFWECFSINISTDIL